MGRTKKKFKSRQVSLDDFWPICSKAIYSTHWIFKLKKIITVGMYVYHLDNFIVDSEDSEDSEDSDEDDDKDSSAEDEEDDSEEELQSKENKDPKEASGSRVKGDRSKSLSKVNLDLLYI